MTEHIHMHNTKHVFPLSFRNIYSTLSQLAMGYPVDELDADSKRFLRECYDVGGSDWCISASVH